MVHKLLQHAPTNHCKLAVFQPIRSETETSTDLAYARFPALGAGCTSIASSFDWFIASLVSIVIGQIP